MHSYDVMTGHISTGQKYLSLSHLAIIYSKARLFSDAILIYTDKTSNDRSYYKVRMVNNEYSVTRRESDPIPMLVDKIKGPPQERDILYGVYEIDEANIANPMYSTKKYKEV